MRAIGRPGKNICTLSSHRATRELYAKVPSHRAPVGAVCEGSMRIELRSELYVKGALCGSTLPFTKIDNTEGHALGKKQLFRLCKCTQHTRHSRMGSFGDRKAYARLILLYEIVYHLVAILLPQYTKPHQIYTSSLDTVTTINIHYCWLLFSTWLWSWFPHHIPVFPDLSDAQCLNWHL